MLESLNLFHVPIPVETVAEMLGADVVFKVFPKKTEMSGMLFRDDHGSAIIAVNSRHHQNRQRFTIAHEIGHLVLHKGQDLFVDRSFKVLINMRNHESGKASDADEIEANRFAAELLMPREQLIEDLKGGVDVESEAVIGRLAEHYQVSTQALSFRIHNLLSS